MPDEQQRAPRWRRGQQGGGVALVEPPRQRLVDDRLAAELHACEPRGFERTHAWAREDLFEAHAQAHKRPARGTRLVLAAGRQATIEVRPGAVGLGIAVPKQPESPRHMREPIA